MLKPNDRTLYHREKPHSEGSDASTGMGKVLAHLEPAHALQRVAWVRPDVATATKQILQRQQQNSKPSTVLLYWYLSLLRASTPIDITI